MQAPFSTKSMRELVADRLTLRNIIWAALTIALFL
jgi:hypothetical protein